MRYCGASRHRCCQAYALLTAICLAPGLLVASDAPIATPEPGLEWNVNASRAAQGARVGLFPTTSNEPLARGSAQDQREALRIRAEADLRAGSTDRALRGLERAVATAREAGDRIGTARALTSLGAACLVAGRLEAAERHLVEAAGLAEAARDEHLRGAAQQTLARVLARLGRDTEARSTYRQLVDSARGRDDLALLARAYLTGAEIEKLAANRGRMHRLLADARRTLERQPAGIEKTAGLVNIARILAEMPLQPRWAGRDLAAAAQALEKAVAVADPANHPAISSFAHGYLGRARELQGRGDEALRLTEQALMTAQRVRADDLLFRWEWQAGRLYAAADQTRAAVAAYRRASLALEQIRSRLFADGVADDASFEQILKPFYRQLADVLLTAGSSGGLGSDTRQRELAEARNAIEHLKTVELQSFFLDECVTATQSAAVGVDTAATRGPAETVAIMYPIILKDRTEVILTLPDGRLHQQTVAAGKDRMTARINELRQALRPVVDVTTGAAYTQPISAAQLPAQRLHAWLIAPIEPMLRQSGVDTLVVVPDTEMLAVPFGVFHDGQRYLIQDYAIAVTPGLTLTEARPLGQGQLQALVAGLPSAPDIGEGIALELKTVEAAVGRNRMTALLDDDFVVGELRRALDRRPYSIVHLSSHAIFGGSPQSSFVETARERLTMDELEALMERRRYSDEAVELLVLSGCQTAEGNPRAALGLSGLAIKSGARSAIGSLWLADSIAAADVLGHFYSALSDNPKLTKAKALQQAQKRLIESAPRPEDDHPTVWAPFILIGNWR